MKKALPIALGLLLMLAAQASGQWPVWLSNVQVTPENPGCSDVPAIMLSGTWGSSCTPNGSAVSVVGNDIYFDVIWDYPEPHCLTVMMPWQRTEAVGPLTAGYYNIYATLSGDPCGPQPYELVGGFTVGPCVYYIDAADGNDNNDGLTEQTAFATIQKGIDTATNGATVIVKPGLYASINFLGKNITLTSTDPTDPNIVAATTINGSYQCVVFRGTEDPTCMLTGFNITGTVHGFDYDIDPTGLDHTHATISHCTFCGNTLGLGTAICQCDGTISNCLFTDNKVEPCLVSAVVVECHGLIKNCTIANNWASGLYITEAGTTTVLNSIIYNNNFGSGQAAIMADTGATLNVLYSNIQGGREHILGHSLINWGPGNIDVDPCFAVPDSNDYHLKSAAGRWDPNQNIWVTDSNTSLCIDAGNPGCPVGDEPEPNGNRINIGAYGGTAKASKSPFMCALLVDLTNDRKADANDLRVFVDYWLESGPCIPADFDRTQTVNATDFAILANSWKHHADAEPAIDYVVGECRIEATASFVPPEPGPTRFSVSAQGNYIHFEDLIVANCCIDEIELQMTVDGNTITIREIEHLTMPCDCICDFPTAATLGPFEDGTYIVEVIDIYGSSLGTAQVTIGSDDQPHMDYSIGPCTDEGPSVATLTEETRFTVTVDGRYLHFEDMMVANCCPDELRIEMTIEGTLITIREVEQTTEPCRCICDFPVAATLGPLEPATYTIKVYQNELFIGAETVTVLPP